MDNETTTDIFIESKYLSNNKTVPTKLNIMTNGGLLTINQEVHLNNYGNLWYHPRSISNILSLSNIKKMNDTIHASKNGDIFIVMNKRPGIQDMIFTYNKDVLYYNDISNTEGVSMLSTVEENRNQYTQRQHEHDKIAREIHQMVVNTLIKDYKIIIEMNSINISSNNGRH